MPTANYEQLLNETIPQVIDNEKQYREIGARFARTELARDALAPATK